MKLEEIKLYCRIDGDDEDNLLEMFKSAAEEYLKGAGIPVKYDDYTYKLTILSMIRYYYDERVSSGAPDKCSDAIIQLQLKYRTSDGNEKENENDW